jgi:hypothetical protein
VAQLHLVEVLSAMKLFWKRRPTIALPPKIIGEPVLPVTHASMVEPLHARAPEAVPGPFYVQSDQCIICALPPETAPNNIQFLPNAADDRCPHYCYVHKQPETVDELQRLLGGRVFFVRCGDSLLWHRSVDSAESRGRWCAGSVRCVGCAKRLTIDEANGPISK